MRVIGSGYVLEATESEEASKLSYDDMTVVGQIRLHSVPDVSHGDDMNDAPFNCNGDIYSGEMLPLRKGDFVIIVRAQ